jgi:translation initiation factor IF-3
VRWILVIRLFYGGVTIAKKERDLFINEQIRAKEVMVIGPNGEQLGLKQMQDALTVAEYAGFDLVLISPNANPKVCKIMDYSKFKYQSKKKSKENMKRQREANLEMKEYRLSVTIDVHDFDTRVRNAKAYLLKGHKIKATIRFRGRQMDHISLGREVLNRFAVALDDISVIEQRPRLEGRSMSLILIQKKEI